MRFRGAADALHASIMRPANGNARHPSAGTPPTTSSTLTIGAEVGRVVGGGNFEDRAGRGGSAASSAGSSEASRSAERGVHPVGTSGAAEASVARHDSGSTTSAVRSAHQDQQVEASGDNAKLDQFKSGSAASIADAALPDTPTRAGAHALQAELSVANIDHTEQQVPQDRVDSGRLSNNRAVTDTRSAGPFGGCFEVSSQAIRGHCGDLPTQSNAVLGVKRPVRRGVVILGMHRSGTSAVALLLKALGAFAGSGKMLEANEGNPLGYGELRGAVQANENLFDAAIPGCIRAGNCWWTAALAGRWDERGPRVSDWDKRRFRSLANGVMRDVSSLSNCSFPAFVLKDPRMCLTLKEWLPIFAGSGVRVAAVLALRHPLAVARSLKHRDRVSRATSAAVWALHTARAIRHAAGGGLPIVTVNYAELLRNTTAVALQLVAQLNAAGVQLSPTTLQLAGAEETIRPSLAHAESEVPEDELDDQLEQSYPSVFRYWKALRDGTALPSAPCCGEDGSCDDFERLPRDVEEQLLMTNV